MTKADDYFDNVIAKDFLNLFASKELGQGVARDVRRLSINPEYVVKIEFASNSFQNIFEYDTWDRVRNTKWAKWFAPCESISPCGTVLIQKFAKDIEENELPEEVPKFFTDLKQENWGIYEGRPVCRDYGLTLLVEHGLTNRMRKADW